MIEFKAQIDAVKSNFFDREKVLQATERAERRAISQFGALVWRKARDLTSRKVGKKGEPSKPGQPPKLRVGLLHRLILFAYEPRTKGTVIGPVAINSTGGRASEVLEHGGDEEILIKGKRTTAHYAARPFMHPAFDQVEREKLPGLLENAIR